jgi:hypothetical protein
VLPAGATTVTYSGFGQVVPNAALGGVVPATITQIDLTSSVLDTARNLRITVSSPGGNARMCDPKLAAGNPQAC